MFMIEIFHMFSDILLVFSFCNVVAMQFHLESVSWSLSIKMHNLNLTHLVYRPAP